MNEHEQYLKLIKTCKFISKDDEWFCEGTEAKLDITVVYPDYEGDTIDSLCGLFEGLTNETYVGFVGELPRQDGETCSFDEFFIYDKFGNDISKMTLNEAQKLTKNETKS